MPRAVTITIWSGWSTIAKKEKKNPHNTLRVKNEDSMEYNEISKQISKYIKTI